MNDFYSFMPMYSGTTVNNSNLTTEQLLSSLKVTIPSHLTKTVISEYDSSEYNDSPDIISEWDLKL